MKIVSIRAILINKMMKYDDKLFHESSHKTIMQSCLQHTNEIFILAPSQGSQNLALLCFLCFRACVWISDNVFTKILEMVTGTI